MADLSMPEDTKIKTEEEESKPGIKLNFGDEIKKKKQEYKPKKIAPKHIFVFDDISGELKNPALVLVFQFQINFYALFIPLNFLFILLIDGYRCVWN